MFPQKNRLTKKEYFDKIFQEGKFLSGKYIVVGFLENNTDLSRLGFLASKKNLNKANLRNRVRRFLREAVRPYLKEIKSGFDITVSYKKTSDLIDKNNREEIKTEIKNIIKKAKLL